MNSHVSLCILMCSDELYGTMEDLIGAPCSQPDWKYNNPAAAARDFVKQNPHFEICEPGPPFNEGLINKFVTYWPSAYIRRKV